MMARPQLPAVPQQFIKFGRAHFRPARLSLILAGAYSALVVPVSANPVGGTVVAGTASITQNGSSLVVKNTPGTIINWRSFNIGSGETTNFIQQSVNSAILNRVVGVNPSSILGSLTSNGRVFLINPNGMVFGKGAMVDTAGLVLSTLNITDADFQAGRMRFVGTSAGTNGDLQIAGVVRSTDGDVYLIAPNIKNTGSISATNGSAVLAAGQSVDIVGKGLDDITFEVQNKGNTAQNLGQITGDAVGMFAGTINQAGGIAANSVSVAGGRVVLSAQADINFAAGSSTSAASGADGGTITARSTGGDINVASGAAIGASGVQGGSITLQAVAGTDSISGSVAATGTMSLSDSTPAHGGTVALLGNQVGLFDSASVDASGTNGGGTVLVGGDWQGKNASIQNASATYVGEGTSITANATDSGNGGKVVVFSEGSTKVGGAIAAMGGVNGGDGGSVETSGKQSLVVVGTPEMGARSSTGKGGNWLLDPTDITISTAASSADMSSSSPFNGTAGTSNLNVTTLDNALTGGATVTVDTTSTAGSLGNITVNTPIVSAGSATLDLNANNNIVLNSGIAAGSGTLNVNLQANQTNAAGVLGSITIASGANISTQGGSFSANGGQFTNNASITTSNTAFGNGGAITVDVALPSGATRTGPAITTGTMITDGSSYDAGSAGSISLTADGDVAVGTISAQGGGSTFLHGANGGTVTITTATGSITGGSINVDGGAGGNNNGTGLTGGNGGSIYLTTASTNTTDTISVPLLQATGGVGGESDGNYTGGTTWFGGYGGHGGQITLSTVAASVVLTQADASGGAGGVATDLNTSVGQNTTIYGGGGGTGGSITTFAPLVTISGIASANGGDGGVGNQPAYGNATEGGGGGYAGSVNFYNQSGALTIGGAGSITANGGNGGDTNGDANGVMGRAGNGYQGGSINISASGAVTLNATDLIFSVNGGNAGQMNDNGSGLAQAGGNFGGSAGSINVSANGGDLIVTGGSFLALGGTSGDGTSYSGTNTVNGGYATNAGSGGYINFTSTGNMTLTGSTLDVSGGMGGNGGSSTGGVATTSTGSVSAGGGGGGGSGGQVFLQSGLDLTATGVTINSNGGQGGQGGAMTGTNQGATSGSGGYGGWAGGISLSAGGAITLSGALSVVGGNGGNAGSAIYAGGTGYGGAGGNGGSPFTSDGVSITAANDVSTSGSITVSGGNGGSSSDVQGYVYNSAPAAINITANPGSGGAGGSANGISIVSYSGQVTSGATITSYGGTGGDGGAILNTSAPGGYMLTSGSGGSGGSLGNLLIAGQTGVTVNGDITMVPGNGGATTGAPNGGMNGTSGSGGQAANINIVAYNGDLNLNGNISVDSSYQGSPDYYTDSSPSIYLAAYGGNINQNSGSIASLSTNNLTLNVSAGGSILLQSGGNNFSTVDGFAGGAISVTSSAPYLYAGTNGGLQAGSDINITHASAPGNYGYVDLGNVSAAGFLTISSDHIYADNSTSLYGNQGVTVQPYNSDYNITIEPVSYSNGIAYDLSALDLGSEFFNNLHTPSLTIGNSAVNLIQLTNPSGNAPINFGSGVDLTLVGNLITQNSNAPIAVDNLLLIANSVSMQAANTDSSGGGITLAAQSLGEESGSNFDFSAGTGQHLSIGTVLNTSGVSGFSEMTLQADGLTIGAPIYMNGGGQVYISPYTQSSQFTLGGVGSGLSLQQSDLDNVYTTYLTLGSTAGSGQVAIVGPVNLDNVSGTVQILNGNADIAFSGGSITANNAYGVSLFTSGNITSFGSAFISTPGSIALEAGGSVGGPAPLEVDAGSGVSLYAGGGNASVSSSGAYDSSGTYVAGNLSISASSISQNSGSNMYAGGTTSLTTSGGAIQLVNTSGNSFNGALSISNGGSSAPISINSDSSVILGTINSGTGALVINSSGGISQVGAITQLGGATGASFTALGGDVDLTDSSNVLRPGLMVSSAGAISVIDTIPLEITTASSTGSGAITLEAPQITVGGTVSGGVVQLAGSSGIAVDGTVQGSSSVSLTSSGGTLAIGDGSSAASVTGGNISLSGANITVTGAGGQGTPTVISASGTLDINTPGNFTISANGSAAEVLSVGNATVQVGGALTLNGGTGNNAFALLDPTASPTVPGNLIVYADSILLNGGSGNGAYAALQSEGNILLHSTNGIVLTPGSGTNADAVVVAPNGSVTYTGTCNACTPYASNPLLNSTSDGGIYSAAPVSAPTPAPPAPTPPAPPAPVPPPAPAPDTTAPPETLNELIQQLVTLWNEGGPSEIDNDLGLAIVVQGDPNDCR